MKTAKLESIWSEYEHAIHAFLRSKVSNEDDVDDLKQEILLKTLLITILLLSKVLTPLLK